MKHRRIEYLLSASTSPTFVYPAMMHDAGHVYGVTNNLNSSRSQALTYDQVNRNPPSGTTATTGTYCWGD